MPGTSKTLNPLGGVIVSHSLASKKVTVRMCHDDKEIVRSYEDLVLNKEKIKGFLYKNRYRGLTRTNYVNFVKKFKSDVKCRKDIQERYIEGDD